VVLKNILSDGIRFLRERMDDVAMEKVLAGNVLSMAQVDVFHVKK
jgi:hypothetical protein